MADSSTPPTPRLREPAWEVRASVSEKTYKRVSAEAQTFGRSRTRQAGLYVEALIQAQEGLSSAERAHVDALLSRPDALREVLQQALALRPIARASAAKGR